jgi:hypothetical protein
MVEVSAKMLLGSVAVLTPFGVLVQAHPINSDL